ncbi:hypothetical protein [Methylophaga sulfidovorans]|nr:hypothetical protein [Methylophaga sulfidovorans]
MLETLNWIGSIKADIVPVECLYIAVQINGRLFSEAVTHRAL